MRDLASPTIFKKPSECSMTSSLENRQEIRAPTVREGWAPTDCLNRSLTVAARCNVFIRCGAHEQKYGHNGNEIHYRLSENGALRQEQLIPRNSPVRHRAQPEHLRFGRKGL